MRNIRRLIPAISGKKAWGYSDTFSSGSSLSAQWTAGTGSTWVVGSGVASNTPATTGSNLLTDGDMEAAGVASWTDYNTPTTKDKVASPAVGSQSLRIIGDAAGDGAYQEAALTAGKIYLATGKLYAGAFPNRANILSNQDGGTLASGLIGFSASAAWTQFRNYRINRSAGNKGIAVGCRDGATTFYADDVGIYEVTYASCMAGIVSAKSNVTVSASIVASLDINAAAHSAVGIFACLDSLTNPQNFILFYTQYSSGSNQRAILLKCVGGTVTELHEGPFSNGAFKIVKTGTSVSTYQNNVQLSTTKTVSDAGIVNNTIHGMFATLGTVDNFSITL